MVLSKTRVLLLSFLLLHYQAAIAMEMPRAACCDTEVNETSFLSEVAMLYGLSPLPYHWQSHKSSYAPCTMPDPEQFISTLALSYSNNYPADYPDRITKLLSSYRKVFRIKGWLSKLVATIKKNPSHFQNKFAPSASTSEFDITRLIAYQALTNHPAVSSAMKSFEKQINCATPISWRDGSGLHHAMRIPVDNENFSCTPY